MLGTCNLWSVGSFHPLLKESAFPSVYADAFGLSVGTGTLSLSPPQSGFGVGSRVYTEQRTLPNILK